MMKGDNLPVVPPIELYNPNRPIRACTGIERDAPSVR
jgi:hypothetical protein